MRREYIAWFDMPNSGKLHGQSVMPKQELIRCKDCRWYKTNYSWDGKEYRICAIEAYEPVRKADDFCNRAERKDND